VPDTAPVVPDTVAVVPDTAAPVPKPAAPASPTKPAAAAAPKTALAARGYLSLDTHPWTRVYLGKASLGETPLLAVPLPAGRHVLRLRNEQEKIDRVIEVDVTPGQKKAMRLKL
jgi:serine/threonine-protein kinase